MGVFADRISKKDKIILSSKVCGKQMIITMIMRSNNMLFGFWAKDSGMIDAKRGHIPKGSCVYHMVIHMTIKTHNEFFIHAYITKVFFVYTK